MYITIHTPRNLGVQEKHLPYKAPLALALRDAVSNVDTEFSTIVLI